MHKISAWTDCIGDQHIQWIHGDQQDCKYRPSAYYLGRVVSVVAAAVYEGTGSLRPFQGLDQIGWVFEGEINDETLSFYNVRDIIPAS